MKTENLCRNGSFEMLLEAKADAMPQDWYVYKPAKGLIEVTDDAADGNRAMRLQAEDGSPIGLNSAAIRARNVLMTFQYKILGSAANGANLGISIVGLNSPEGPETKRWTFTPPSKHVADGAWHSGELEVKDAQTEHCIVAIRINEATPGSGAGEWLIDNVSVFAISKGAEAVLAYTWSDKPLANVGETIRFSAWVDNSGDAPALDAQATLELPDGLHTERPLQIIKEIPPRSYERLDWDLKADHPMRADVAVSLTYRPKTDAPPSPPSKTANYTFLILDPDVKKTRQEICTDGRGFWHRLERPASLQANNPDEPHPVHHKKSDEISHNLYGICAQVPRSKDYEKPFDPIHLIDGDPETVWSSQQRPNSFVGNPPWVEINLKAQSEIKRIHLVPFWRNTDFPIGFRIFAGADEHSLKTILDVRNHQFVNDAPLLGDKRLQVFELDEPVLARHFRFEFTRLPLSGGHFAEVSQGYKARLSGIEIIDADGRNVALIENGASVRANEFFTAWQSTAESIKHSFERIFDIGLKWVRISQWGDQTEWAAIEREKGIFRTDPVTDIAIDKLTKNGVDILYGLDYGNHHYSNDEIWNDIGPTYREGMPFSWNLGPSTPEQREAFVRYVDFVVRQYKGSVRWWELWNEQNGWYPIHAGVTSFQPELYGKLLYDVARRIKSIDPNLKVMYGGTAAPAPVSTEIALREGAAPYVDITAFHPYGSPMPEKGLGTMECGSDGTNYGRSREDMGWDAIEDVIEGVRKPFAQHGNPNVEVWMNEFGTNVEGLDFTYHPGIGEYACAKYITRFYIYSAWLGVPTAWWALHNLNRSQDWGIIGIEDYGFRPMSYALQNVCSVVSDVSPVRDIEARFEAKEPVKDLKIISFRRTNRDETLVLLWSAEMHTDEVRAYPGSLTIQSDRTPKSVVITDLYWGIEQKAAWTLDDGRISIPNLTARDYPTVITMKWK